jgi:hypothetical protein
MSLRLSRHSSSSSAPVTFVEPLESRALLAADLAVLSASTTNLAAAGSKTGTITLKNTGTTTINGKVNVTFTATPAAGGKAQTLGSKSFSLSNLKRNASKGLPKITLKAPTGSGKFNVKATISAVFDSKPANNSKAAGSVNIKKTGGGNNGGNTGGSSNGDAVWGITGAGTKLKFKKTKNLPGNGIQGFIHESGTFTDGNGHSGTYSLAIPPAIAVNTPAQILDIEFKTIAGSFQGGSRRYVVTFTPASKRLNAGLNGKTVTFSKSAAGSSAKAAPISGFLGTIYLKY